MTKIRDDKISDWLRPRSLGAGLLDSIPATFQNLSHGSLTHGLGPCYSQLSFKISFHPLYSPRQPDLYLLTLPLVVCSARQWKDGPKSQYQSQRRGPVQGLRDQPDGHWLIIIHNLPSGQHLSTNPCMLAFVHGTGEPLVILSQGPSPLCTVSPGLLPEIQLLTSSEQAAGNHIRQVNFCFRIYTFCDIHVRTLSPN